MKLSIMKMSLIFAALAITTLLVSIPANAQRRANMPTSVSIPLSNGVPVRGRVARKVGIRYVITVSPGQNNMQVRITLRDEDKDKYAGMRISTMRSYDNTDSIDGTLSESGTVWEGAVAPGTYYIFVFGDPSTPFRIRASVR